MQKLPRTLWEILILAVLAAIGYGLWTWSDVRWQRRIAEHEDRLRAEIVAERDKAAEVVRKHRASEAEAAARAFAAGIRAHVLEGRHEDVDVAVGSLLHLPGVTFVHVLGRDGSVISTSDRKLVATGRPGERASWAMAAAAVSIRAGSTPETTEVAVPIGDADGAVLWMAYETGAPQPGSAPPAELETFPEADSGVDDTPAESGAPRG